MSYINKEGKVFSWRRKVILNLIFDIFSRGSVITSLPNSKILKKFISKLISFSKKNTLHSKRLSLRYITGGAKRKEIFINKLFIDLRNKYENRNGGYVRVNKLYRRRGDNTLRVLVSLV